MTDLGAVERVELALPPAEAIVALTSAAIYTTDAAGTITYFNEPAVDLWGTRPVLGETKWCGSWRIYTTQGEPLPLSDCPMAVCLAKGQSVDSAEIVVERPDGTRRQVQVHPTPIRDLLGQLVGAVNTLHDVTAIREAEHARVESETLAQRLLDASQDCIKLLDLNGDLKAINAAGCDILELSGPREAAGLSYFDFWTGSEREAAKSAFAAALKDGSGRFQGTFESSSGRRTIWDEVVTVLRDDREAPNGFVVVSRDTTEQHVAAAAGERRLRQQKALSEIGHIALSKLDFNDALQRIASVLAEALDCPFSKVLQFADEADRLLLRAGIGWHSGLVGSATVGTDRDSQAGFTLLTGSPVVVDDLESELRFNGPKLLLEHGVRSGISVPIPGSSDRPFGVLGVHDEKVRNFDAADVDFVTAAANVIASRWRQEEDTERRTLLVREMAHRAGNLLQLASSIFGQTFRSTPDVAEATKKFGQRLAALGRTNMAVARGGWSRTNLRELAQEILEPFESRVSFSGPDLILPADLCFDIGMIWHELSTNSAKYGSFSRDSGAVSIVWRIATNSEGVSVLFLDWIDTASSTPAPSTGTHFGTRLLYSLVEGRYHGKITVNLEPHYVCRIELPLKAERAP